MQMNTILRTLPYSAYSFIPSEEVGVFLSTNHPAKSAIIEAVEARLQAHPIRSGVGHESGVSRHTGRQFECRHHIHPLWY
jgi:hypothetical protein